MDVRYEQYVGEERDLEAMMTLVDQELSEPYVTAGLNEDSSLR
jgi:hypothetical protein